MSYEPLQSLFGATRPTAQTRAYADDGRTPNSALPALIYRGRPGTESGLADALEALFAHNGWPPQWRGGVFDFHHYHSVSHEALGVAAGTATLMLGGERGERVAIAAGDVLVLPAGIGHCRVDGSPDFELIGAYPPDQQHWDLCRSSDPQAYAEASARIAKVPRPAADPVLGRDGGVCEHWHTAPA